MAAPLSLIICINGMNVANKTFLHGVGRRNLFEVKVKLFRNLAIL